MEKGGGQGVAVSLADPPLLEPLELDGRRDCALYRLLLYLSLTLAGHLALAAHAASLAADGGLPFQPALPSRKT